MPDVLLSIGVPSLTTRPRFVWRMLEILNKQIGVRQDVELFVLCDNAAISVGEKHNRMMEMMKGEYVCFLGDDDEVVDDFVETILSAIKEHRPDCVTYNIDLFTNGDFTATIREGVGLGCTQEDPLWTRPASAKMPMRREIADKYKYPDLSYGEDVQFADWAKPHLKSEHYIDRSLYKYYWRTNNQEGKAFHRQRGRSHA